MPSNSIMFRGRHITIATKHGKEKALAPLVSTILEAIPVTCSNIDTDQFGSFSGEITRTGTPIETLRAKTELAYQITGHRKFIVSEGSFGAHPYIPFITANEEWLLYTDLDLQHEVFVRSISTETNYAQQEVQSVDELNAFLANQDFPENGLILIAKEQQVIHQVIKDFQSEEALINVFTTLKEQFQQILIQTDMRAHKNTLRMKHIELTGRKLIERMQSTCPACHFPGFGVTSIEKGLPCKYCQAPTNDILAEHLECTNCQFNTKNMYPLNRKYADPGTCNLCNP